jgi:PAS domain S-box-containing protein
LGNTVPCGLYEYTLGKDGVGIFHYVNKRALEIFEIDDFELTDFNRLSLSMLRPEDVEKVVALDRQVNRSFEMFFIEVEITTRSGKLRWIRMSSLPSGDRLGDAAIWSGYILDITEERRLRNEVMQRELELVGAANKAIRFGEIESLNNRLESLLQEKSALLRSTAAYAKANNLGALISSLAHELNNPLGAISIHSQSLQMAVADMRLNGVNIEVVDALDEIASGLLGAGKRAASVISNLRSFFVRGELGVARFDISSLVNGVCELLRREMGVNHIHLHRSVQPSIRIQGDRGQLQMVFLNALNNAIDALREWGGERQIFISLREVDAHILFEVRDTGPGFKRGTLKKAFELFHTTKERGMGVGLWLSREIVGNHRGDITLTNEPGGGAVLRVSLEKE